MWTISEWCLRSTWIKTPAFLLINVIFSFISVRVVIHYLKIWIWRHILRSEILPISIVEKLLSACVIQIWNEVNIFVTKYYAGRTKIVHGIYYKFETMVMHQHQTWDFLCCDRQKSFDKETWEQFFSATWPALPFTEYSHFSSFLVVD